MRQDPHSYADDQQPTVDEVDWQAHIDFDRHLIQATAHLFFTTPGQGPLDLDTRDLSISGIEDANGQPLPFELSAADPILGQRLRVRLAQPTGSLRIRYETSPQASALQWLTPAQTAGGKLPFLFSQCQAIHARSLIPLQDTPRNRIRYRATVNVPRSMRALMSAGQLAREERGHRAVERFEMLQPIAPYLFALAVGDLVSRDLGPRSRVWAEPVQIEAAAYEFAEVDSMLTAAELLFGPYDWERFDFLVLPPSFPYGGMENPRLTFLTPTLLAGDRSLVAVLAHELAHSWAGNLVTNANAEHFWLNEGLTVYAERRIIEALYGPDVAAVSAAGGWHALEQSIANLRDRPELTCLRTHLTGISPDDAFSSVPYEKGYLLFKAMEESLTRPVFDSFLKRYLQHFRFKSLTTEEFVKFVDGLFPRLLQMVDAASFFDSPGIPPGARRPVSARLQSIEALGTRLPTPAQAKNWTPSEWEVWIAQLKGGSLTASSIEEIDEQFGLTQSGNYEILGAWLELAIGADYPPAIPRVEQVLGAVGRMKYLKPLYRALARRDLQHAQGLFARNRAGYHPIAVQVIGSVLKSAESPLE